MFKHSQLPRVSTPQSLIPFYNGRLISLICILHFQHFILVPQLHSVWILCLGEIPHPTNTPRQLKRSLVLFTVSSLA